MIDRFGNKIFKGDVVTAIVKSTNPQEMSYTITGIVRKVRTFRTGYGVGGSIEVILEPRNDQVEIAQTVRDSKNVIRLSNEDAMLWKLENS